jgi:PIN domain nuclease of toxin-antitoxin system
MNILIDTQVFIWLINGNKSLGNKASRLIHDLNNDIYLSYFSVFEMVIKSSIGKLEYDDTVLDDLSQMGIELLIADRSTLRNYKIYNPVNRDPFDNALISVAISENCIFITGDTKILSIKEPALNLIDATL